jgi:hypothetical protein
VRIIRGFIKLMIEGGQAQGINGILKLIDGHE